MFRVGIIINENEASHSKYADTEATLQAAIYDCNRNGAKGNSYHFVLYDKFTINKLFDAQESDIRTLNALVIATNALSFEGKVYAVLCDNRKRIEDFLDSSGGIFISSQKKLSNGHLNASNCEPVGFLPDACNYYIFDRPEKYSSEGTINITSTGILLNYPYTITDELINNRCDNNKFMPHKYRSLIIPDHPKAYEALLCDQASGSISQPSRGYNGPRNLLLYSNGRHRVVISTMALDWANHAELLCNILAFIAESERRIIFVRKQVDSVKNTTLESYKIRANIANIPYREIAGLVSILWATQG